MRLFRCWERWEGNEDEGRSFEAVNARAAALAYGKYRWHRLSPDYPSEQEICVRDGNRILHFHVEVEVMPYFVAHEVPAAKPKDPEPLTALAASGDPAAKRKENG